MQLSPPEFVIHTFGGVRATARALELSPGAISHWLRKQTVPTKRTRKILAKAEELQLDIKPHDLIFGRDIPMGDM